jgi:8-hydroxy-5-deazaflavin:NADPH oxidoreductase
MKYSIVGTGLVGKTLAGIFARQGMRALIANSRGPESLSSGRTLFPLRSIGHSARTSSSSPLAFCTSRRLQQSVPDWAGKIVIDATNAFMLPAEIQQSELHGRLSSEVNAERVPGAKLVKAFNQQPMRALIAPLPDSTGRRVVFVASDYEDAGAEVSHLAEQLGFAPVQVGKIAEGGLRCHTATFGGNNRSYSLFTTA